MWGGGSDGKSSAQKGKEPHEGVGRLHPEKRGAGNQGAVVTGRTTGPCPGGQGLWWLHQNRAAFPSQELWERIWKQRVPKRQGGACSQVGLLLAGCREALHAPQPMW